ncbi:hypothetical protein F5884DRAFT_887171 [Xylogone sp. PMI_703]|nr:hypothetical protein F5884DRAFT_887171 [Xylogone sp. PMI_703]
MEQQDPYPVLEDEDYNQPSQERIAVLKRLDTALGSDVSAHLWAACHICDIEKLRQLAGIAETEPNYIFSITDLIDGIFIGWDGEYRLLDPESELDTPSDSDPDHVETARSRAILRGDNHCVLTGSCAIEVAQILPWHIYQKTKGPQRAAFWDTIKLFYPAEKVTQWFEAAKAEYYTPANLFCLNQVASALWRDGCFALKPISKDEKTLTVQFFWQVNSLQPPNLQEVNLLVPLPSTKGLDGPEGSKLELCTAPGRRIVSGDIFVLKTVDPKTNPLPSFELLELQWFVHRVLAMAGPVQEPIRSWDMEYESEYESEHESEYESEYDLGYDPQDVYY